MLCKKGKRRGAYPREAYLRRLVGAAETPDCLSFIVEVEVEVATIAGIGADRAMRRKLNVRRRERERERER